MNNLLIFLLTLVAYCVDRGNYRASFMVHAFAIAVSLYILITIKDLNKYARWFIVAILSWHLIDVGYHFSSNLRPRRTERE